MKYVLGMAVGVLAGSGVVALYNAFVEEYVPDIMLISVTKKTADGEIRVPYLMLDDAARVLAVLAVGVPAAIAIHNLAPGIIPTPPVK